jgi:hypothetical protein
MSTNSADSEAMDTVVIMEEDATAQASTPADNQDAPTVPCSIFTCFPKLPIELRHKIWKYASFVTRNICVSVMEMGTIDHIDDDYLLVDFDPFIYSTGSAHPSILHACHESGSAMIPKASIRY